MTIYQAKGFRPTLHPSTGNIDPFDYIANFKPMKPPEGMVIDEFKRTQAPYCLSGKIKAEKNGTYKRNNQSLIYRDLIFLDYDDIDTTSENFKKQVLEVLSNYSYILYPTIKHTSEKPRYRLVVKPSNVMNEDIYKLVVNEIAGLIGLPFDMASLTWSQLMGLPVTRGNPEDYDKVVNVGLEYPAPESAESDKDISRNNAPTSKYKPSKAKHESLTMRVINTLFNGFGDEGGRNVALTRFVGLLLSKYVNCDVATAYELVKIANDVTGQPLPLDELDNTFESIVKTEIRKRGLGL